MLDFLVENTQEDDTMTKESLAKAREKYDKANTRMINFKFNLKTDADILAKLDSIPNKQGYIKTLIRADMEGDTDSISKGDAISCLQTIKRALEGLDL